LFFAADDGNVVVVREARSALRGHWRAPGRHGRPPEQPRRQVLRLFRLDARRAGVNARGHRGDARADL